MTDTDHPPDPAPVGDGGRNWRDVPPTEPGAGVTASFTLGPDGRVRDWNREAASLTGWDDDVVDERVSVLFADGSDGLGDRDIDDALNAAARTGHFETGVRCVGPAGAIVPASATITPLKGTGEGPAAYTVVLRDETVRTQLAGERRLLAAVSRGIARAESFAEGIETALARERALLEQVFETSPVGLLVADTDGTIERANGAAGEIAGCPPESLTGRRVESIGEFRDANDETVPDGESPVARAVETGETVEGVDLQVEAGERVWARVSASPLRSDEGSPRVTVALEDVTEHREREQSLRIFREAVEQAGHSIYVTDPDGTIRYVNPAFEEMTEYAASEAIGQTPAILNSGEHDTEFFRDLWETILDSEVWTGEVVNERKSGEQYVINQTIAPIVDDAGGIEQFVAVNDEITDRKRLERTLRRQRNSLERVRQILESLRPINRDLARAGTREEIDRIVCEQLAASDAYLFAWVGDYSRAAGQIDPREWAGIADGFVDALDLSGADGFDPGPFDRAVSEREVSVLREIPTDPASETRRDRALTYGYQSVAAVPVTYGETVLGVIGVYSARPEAFDEYERRLLRELGERIGHAINAAENKRLLQADTVVEVEFEVGAADSPLASVAADLDCRLSVTSVTPTDDRGYLCYVEVDGEPPAAVVDALAGRADVSRSRAVRARGDTGVVEAIVRTGPTPALLERGATVRSLEAAEDGATLTVETAPQSDVGALIADIEAAYPETIFLAKRTHTREAATLTTTQTAVEEVLTDRQREVLALAYHAGFFESPRDSTGTELAEALGVSAPTFYQHVRKSVRKILRLLVDTDDLRPAPARDESPAATND